MIAGPNIYLTRKNCKACGAIGTVEYICRSYHGSGYYCTKCEAKHG